MVSGCVVLFLKKWVAVFVDPILFNCIPTFVFFSPLAANQVDIRIHNRIPMDVHNVQKDTYKALKALFYVHSWVPMPLGWGVVLLKSMYHPDRI